MNVCIIPARGGSKRVPRKNIRAFLGDPIIKYPIRAALDCGMFSRVIVSSEDDEIGEIACLYGAEWLPRSSKNATDESSTRDVLEEVMSQARARYVCEMYATAALVSPARIVEAFERMKELGASSTRCVVRHQKPAWFSYEIRDGKCVTLFPEIASKKTAEVGDTYEDAGSFYWFDWAKWDYNDPFTDCVPIEVSPFETQDVDTLTDVTLAELKFFLTRRSMAY